MIRDAILPRVRLLMHGCPRFSLVAAMLLFCICNAAPLSAYPNPSSYSLPDTVDTEPDTTIIDISQFELYTPPKTLPHVISYKPFDNSIVLSLAADSVPLVRMLPRWAKIFFNSWTQASEDRTRQRKVDFNFAVAPSYSREASFGLGGSITALFRLNRNDSLPQPSFCFASVNASLNGFYIFKSRGRLFFPDDRSRLSYTIELSRKRLHFWGISAFETTHNPLSRYTRSQSSLSLTFDRRVWNNLFIGIEAFTNFTAGSHFSAPEYLLGENSRVFATGFGPTLSFDTRNADTEPKSGVYATYRPIFFPQFLGSISHFFQSHRVNFNSYNRVWSGAVLATDLYARFTSRHTPWTLREMTAADGSRMRGYYMGRYIDHNQVAAQIELRQHIWDRLGVVAWAGMASLFSHFGADELHSRQVWLPNAGFGIRLRYKPNVNGRIDFGFGRHSFGILVSMGEAF